MASLIPESISDTLGDLVGLYSQVEAIKLNNALAKARASADAAGSANATSNPQASANNEMPMNQINPWVVGGVVLAAAIGIYLVAR